VLVFKLRKFILQFVFAKRIGIAENCLPQFDRTMLTSNWAYMRGANLRTLTCMKREHVLWTLGSHWVGDLCVLFCSRAPRHASTFSWRTPGKVIRALVKHAFYWFSCVRDRDGSFQFARLFGKKPWGSVRQLVEYINLCRILVSQKKKIICTIWSSGTEVPILETIQTLYLTIYNAQVHGNYLSKTD